MTSDATSPRAPIGALRISTLAMAGVIAAVSVPAATAAFAMSSQVSDQRALVPIRAAGPVSRIVVSDSASDVQITADPAADGVSGQGVVQWKGKGGKRPVLEQSLAGSVLTLTKDCSGGGCGAIDLTLSVPSGVSVQATTSKGHIVVVGVTGGVDLTSSDGSIDAQRLGSGDAAFRTTDGSIDASFAGAPARIAAHSTSGEVTVATDGRTAYYDFVTSGGGTTTLKNVQDRRSAAEIDVTTTDADVTIS
jgi:putative adhesin